MARARSLAALIPFQELNMDAEGGDRLALSCRRPTVVAAQLQIRAAKDSRSPDVHPHRTGDHACHIVCRPARAVIGEVRVALGRRDILVAEQRADHGQR